jgi:hypothetical protein
MKRSKKPQQLNAAIYEQVAKKLLRECAQIARKRNFPVKQFCKAVAGAIPKAIGMQHKLEHEAFEELQRPK